MRWLAPIALMLLAACGGGAPQADEAGRGADLIGLYESPAGPRHNQMCVVPGAAEGPARFGIIVWGDHDNSCTGSGTVERNGGTLRLTMTGDPSCVVDARLQDDRITMPDRLPAGCAYYCGREAHITDASFGRTGSTAADALRARDLAGEPLCGG